MDVRLVNGDLFMIPTEVGDQETSRQIQKLFGQGSFVHLSSEGQLLGKDKFIFNLIKLRHEKENQGKSRKKIKKK